MNLKIQYESFAVFFILIIFVSYQFLPPAISMAITVLAIGLFFNSSRSSNLYLLKLTMPLLLIPFIAMAGLFENRSIYNIAKDIWYFVNPIIIIFAGFYVGSKVRNKDRLIWLVISLGLFLSIKFIYDYNTIGFSGANDYKAIRDEVGKSSYLSVFALVFIIEKIKNSKLERNIALSIAAIFILLSISLSFSRTMWVITFLSVVIINLRFLGVSLYKKLVITSFIVVTASFILFSLEGTTFYNKLIFSLQEVSSTQHWTLVDINERWRAYETHRAMSEYFASNNLELFIGKGAGYLLDLKILMDLGGESFKYIPILHNGFAFLLLKTGAAGLLCYLIFFVNLFNSTINRICYSQDLFIFVLVIIMLLTTFVISGLYNKQALSQMIFFIGVAISFKLRKVELL